MTKNLRKILKLPDGFNWGIFWLCLHVLFWDNGPVFIDAVRLEKHVVRRPEKVSWFLIKFFRLVWIWISRYVFCLHFLKLVQKSQIAWFVKYTSLFKVLFHFIKLWIEYSFVSYFVNFELLNVIGLNRSIISVNQNRILKSVVYKYITW